MTKKTIATKVFEGAQESMLRVIGNLNKERVGGDQARVEFRSIGNQELMIIYKENVQTPNRYFVLRLSEMA